MDAARMRRAYLGVLLQLRDGTGGMAVRGLRGCAIVVPHRRLLPLAELRMLSVATRCCRPRRMVDRLPGMPRSALMRVLRTAMPDFSAPLCAINLLQPVMLGSGTCQGSAAGVAVSEFGVGMSPAHAHQRGRLPTCSSAWLS